MKNRTRYFFMLLAIIMGITACKNDGDLIMTNGADALTLSGSGDVVLDREDLGGLALTLYWNDNSRLALNNDAVQAPLNVTTNTLQFSSSEDFANVVEQLIESGETSAQFTMEALNSLAGRIGLQGDVSSLMYIRIRSVLANNVSPQYSNVYSIHIIPYTIDMTRGYVLDANRENTGFTLGSPDSDGIYSGFLGVPGWYNFWLQEGNGTIWGNEGVTGTPFIISQEDSHWNFWYPNPEGCYYTVVNTQRQEWSALYVSSLSVSGDITGEMSYNRSENKWTLAFNAERTGNMTIRLTGSGLQYNAQTGTDDAAAIPVSVAFGQTGNELTFGTEASDITVNVPATGETTLTLDLNDPFAWTCKMAEGAEPVTPEASPSLWIVGVDDADSGSWNFEQDIPLINEGNLMYAGVVNVNSLWGYRIYTEKDVWTGYYGLNAGNAEQGTLVSEVENNIPSPQAGLYLLDVSLSDMTYQTTAINSVQITGIGDNWDLIQMQPADEPGVFYADVNVTAPTPWGYQIILNENWETYLGGTADQLLYVGENIPLDDSYVGGTWRFMINLCQGTITITNN